MNPQVARIVALEILLPINNSLVHIIGNYSEAFPDDARDSLLKAVEHLEQCRRSISKAIHTKGESNVR